MGVGTFAPNQFRPFNFLTFALDRRRAGARALTPTGVRLSKSKAISLAWGMLNSNIRSNSAEPAARSAGAMS